MKKHAVILCAGRAARADLGFNKVLFPIGEKSVLETVLDKFADFDKIIVASSGNDLAKIVEIAGHYPNVTVTTGGETRSDSVRRSLAVLNETSPGDIVAIHDAARPFLSHDLIDRCVQSAIKDGSGIAAVRVIDSVKETFGGHITETLNRDKLYAVQTPQAFRLAEIKAAYKNTHGAHEDDSEVYRLAGYEPVIVEGEYSNKKLTVPSDFLALSPAQAVGTGFDVHQLADGRPLILGGVRIPYPLGLLGHSDADALLHAVADALLSAAGLPDIGNLFPDTDPKFRGADSMVLLKEAAGLLKNQGRAIKYISAVIMAQKPKMAPYINEMRTRTAEACGIDANMVNISATTTELLGIIGEGKGIAASAVCLCSQL